MAKEVQVINTICRPVRNRQMDAVELAAKVDVMIVVGSRSSANTLELTARLDRVLDTLQAELPKGMTIDRRIFRQADFIEFVATDTELKRALAEPDVVVQAMRAFLAETSKA